MMDLYLPPHPRGKDAIRHNMARSSLPEELTAGVEVIVDAIIKRTDPHLTRERYVDELIHLLELAYLAGYRRESGLPESIRDEYLLNGGE